MFLSTKPLESETLPTTSKDQPKCQPSSEPSSPTTRLEVIAVGDTGDEDDHRDGRTDSAVRRTLALVNFAYQACD
jgi:hypothetical protein